MSLNKMRLFEAALGKAKYYTSTDIDYIQSVIDEIVQDLSDQADPRAEPTNRKALRDQLAQNLLKWFALGQRDFEWLKREALATLEAPSSRWPRETSAEKRVLVGADSTHISLHDPVQGDLDFGDRPEIRLSQTRAAPSAGTSDCT